jgi:hypothetical protein
MADGIIKYGSSYNEGIWKSLNFELKSGYTGRICQQLSDGMRSKVSFINGFYIYIDHDLAPFEGFRFRYTTSEGLKNAIEFIPVSNLDEVLSIALAEPEIRKPKKIEDKKRTPIKKTEPEKKSTGVYCREV